MVLQLASTVFCSHCQLGAPKAGIVHGDGKQLNTRAGMARTTSFFARPASFSVCRPAGGYAHGLNRSRPLGRGQGSAFLVERHGGVARQGEKAPALAWVDEGDVRLPKQAAFAGVHQLAYQVVENLDPARIGRRPAGLLLAGGAGGGQQQESCDNRKKARPVGHELASGGGSLREPD